MSSRAIGILILSLAGFPVVIFGPEQYGYAFIGLLAGLGAFAESIGAQSPGWMILFPMLTIVLTVIFSITTISVFGYSIIQIVGYPQAAIQHRSMRFIPVGFACAVIAGLGLMLAFPSEPPIMVPGAFFLFPSALMFASTIHALSKV